MMRRGTAWGAAVRRTDGTIETTSRNLKAPTGLRQMPLVRGLFALVDSVMLGTRATLWAAQTRGGADGSDYHPAGLALTVTIAMVAVLGIFGIFPGAAVKWMGVENIFLFSLIEGLIRLVILVGYLLLLGRSAQVKRVFAYHGAEHMTIHAFEHRAPLEAESIRGFDRRHPRCGTAFLIVVVMVTIVAHTFIGNPSWTLLIASRVLGLPVVAGIAYEAIRFAGRHQDSLIGKVLMAPGSWLQTITTAEPSDDMIEVAIRALEATLAAETMNHDRAAHGA